MLLVIWPKKICARWVTQILTNEHKQRGMGATLTSLNQYDKEFLNHIVTGDKTWIFHNTPETKRQAMA